MLKIRYKALPSHAIFLSSAISQQIYFADCNVVSPYCIVLCDIDFTELWSFLSLLQFTGFDVEYSKNYFLYY